MATIELTNLEKYKETEIMRCMRCGFCCALCPSLNMYGWETSTPRARMQLIRGLLYGDLGMTHYISNSIFTCTLCGYCEWRCPAGAKITAILEDTRADFANAKYNPEKHRKFFQSILENENPYFEKREDRLKWLPKSLTLPETADVLYFVGCTTAYRTTESAVAMVKLLDKAGVNFTTSNDEVCCESVLWNTGQREEIRERAQRVKEYFKDKGAKKVVTSCAGCFRTFKEFYPEKIGVDPGVEVLHASEFLEQLITQERLNLRKLSITATYHDPCHLGRHLKVYDPPRNVLKVIGVEIKEIPFRNRDTASCCGAGAGVKASFRDFSLKASTDRVLQAKKTGAKTFVTSCPFCFRNLSDGIKMLNEDMDMFDLPVLVAQACL